MSVPALIVIIGVVAVVAGVGTTVVAALTPPTAAAQPSIEVSGTPVEGGPALIDATPLDVGTFTDAILTGDVRWFEVEAGDNETLTARATMTTAGIAAGGGVQLTWLDENAREVAVGALRTSGRGQATTVAVTTGEIDGARTTGGAVLDAGPYYLAVEVVDFPPDRSTPYVLEVIREAPQPAEDPSAPDPAPLPALPDPEATGAVPTTAESAPPAGDPSASDRTGLWLVLASVVTAAAAVALLLRYRLRGRAEPPRYQ